MEQIERAKINSLARQQMISITTFLNERTTHNKQQQTFVAEIFIQIRNTLVNGLNPGVSVVCLVWSSGWVQFWKELLVTVTDVSTTWATTFVSKSDTRLMSLI